MSKNISYTVDKKVHKAVEKVDKIKDLGVTFDSRLKFDEHIDIKFKDICVSYGNMLDIVFNAKKSRLLKVGPMPNLRLRI